jgi:hypothetical protein
MYILVKIPMSSFFSVGISRKSHNVAGGKGRVGDEVDKKRAG